MKRTIAYGLILLLTVLCVGITACGGSGDDGDTGAGAQSALVGLWKYDLKGGSGYVNLQFNNDGTGYEHEYDINDGGWHSKKVFSWKYDESTKILTLNVSGKSSVDEYDVVELTSSTLTIVKRNYMYPKTETYIKQ